MVNLLKKFNVFALIVFTLAITGCLSGGNQTGAKPKPVDPVVVADPDNDTNAEFVPYNSNSNKKPVVTYFGTDDLDTAVLAQGQTIELKATAMDPEDSDVTIKYVVNNQELDGNKWTAPQVGGLYAIKAIASDGELESDPEVLTVSVPGKEGGIQVGAISVNKASSNAPSRAISAATTAVTKYVLETNETIAITLTYTSDTASAAVTPEFSVASNAGLLVETASSASGATYTKTFTYTAAGTIPSGNNIDIVFNIVNTVDVSDYAQATLTLIINTPPVISSVVFSGEAPTSIATSSTKSLTVVANAGEVDDTLTYTYEIYSGNGLLDGSSEPVTNTSGTVDYTSSSSKGTEKVLVIVTDQRGSKAQTLFQITVADPMLLEVADEVVALTYETIMTGGSFDSQYDVTTELVSGTEYELPILADFDTDWFAANYDNGVKAYITNYPNNETDVTYDWTDTIDINGNSYSLRQEASFAATSTDANPTWFGSLAGMHTLEVTAQDGVLVRDSETVYVNEPTEITSITYADSQGNVQSLWDGTTVWPVVQVSPGQLMDLTINFNDADNERVGIDTTMYSAGGDLAANQAGFFADETGKFFLDIASDHNGTAWTTLGSNDTTEARIEAGAGYTNTDTVTNSITGINYEIKPQANSGTGVYQYLVFRASDGMDNEKDGAQSLNITQAPGALAVLPSAAGIPVAFDDANTGTDFDESAELVNVKVGYNPNITNHTGNFYLECTDATTNEWKVYDIDAGAHIKRTDTGAEITITIDANATLTAADILPAPYNWLYIDINNAAAADATGDKIYFKTYCTQVITRVEVITGPKIITVSHNKYVTLGETTNILVYGDNDGDPATVSLNLTSSDGGTLEEVTDGDTDNDSVSAELWRYTAPSSLSGTQTVKINVSITDDTDTTQVITRSITFGLNRKPVINSIVATSSVDTTDGVWAKAGIHNISLATTVSDPDTTDSFGYIWNMGSSNMGSLDFHYTSSAIWDPYNGPTQLTATGGPTLNGHYPILLTVYDMDTVGVAKTGIAQYALDIGINENPDVGKGGVDGLVGDDANNGVAYDSTTGSLWAAAGNLVDAGGTGSGTGTTTLQFNTDAQYPEVKVEFAPNGVDDEPDDKSSLNYSFYLTNTQENGTPITSETLQYLAHTDATTGLATRKVIWEPSLDMRKNGGTYWIHARVTDDKNGVAKGITDYTERISVERDTTPPEVAADGDITININGKALAGTEDLKIGDEVEFIVARTITDGRDLGGVSIDVSELVGGAAAALGTDVIELELNDQETLDPKDDTFEYTFIVPAGTGAGRVDDATGVLFQDITPRDIVGNASPAADQHDHTLTVGLDNEAPIPGAYDALAANIAVDTEPFGAGDGTMDALQAHNSSNLAAGNGNTDLQDVDDVYNIGDNYEISFAVTASTPVGDDSTTTGKIDLTTIDGVSSIESNWFAIGVSAANLASTAGKTLAEQPTVSKWGGATYPVDYYLVDDDGNKTYGNQDILDTATAAGDATGIDLKRPTVLNVEIYSYDKTATATDPGYAPVGWRNTGADLTDFALIDATITGIQTVNATNLGTAKDIIDDEDTTTAEIIKITFDEPLYVGTDLALSAGGANDAAIGSTVNDWSLSILQYRADGINKDNISDGAAVYEDAAVVPAASAGDDLNLFSMKNYAYTQTGTSETDTSTVYILLQSKTLTGTDITVPLIAAGATGDVTVAGLDGKAISEISAGEYLELYDDDAAATYTGLVTAVVDDNTITIKNVDTAANIPASTLVDTDERMCKAVAHIPLGNHLEVIFNDFIANTDLDGGAEDMYKILCDQHGNAISASLNNHVKGSKEISW